MTRDAIGARLVGSTYAERWLVIDALIDNHDVDTITFFCDPRRPTVRLPAVGSRVRFEFMQLPGESPDELASDDSHQATVWRRYVGFSRRRNRTSRRLHLPRPRRRRLAQGPCAACRRRRAFDAAVCRAGDERRHEGCCQSCLEARRRDRGKRRRRHPRYLRNRARAKCAQHGERVAPARRRHHAHQPGGCRPARYSVCAA